MLAWWPKVKRGGVFAGHDYKPGFTSYYAIIEFGRKMNLPIFVTSPVYGLNREYSSPSWYILKQ